MKRYHPLLVTFHWLLALMICGGLFMGGQVLSATPNSTPEKLFYLKMHMSMGIIILVLMLLRFVVRLKTVHPPEADIGNAVINKLGKLAHYLFYIVVFLICGSGIGIAVMAGLPDIVFNGSGNPLPINFDHFPPRMAHGVLTKLLVLLIAGHVAAFVFHQFAKKDSLFSRMWYGKRD